MASHQLKVLIAEDNRVFGDVLKFNLERHGLDVTLMRTGDAAARALAEQTFDLLLTDIEMPGMRGDELCRLARQQLNLASLKIVVCSARGLELDQDYLKNALAVSAIVFKPFSMRDIFKLLDSLHAEILAEDAGLSLARIG
jgi:two-component system OmpR family response regulator